MGSTRQKALPIFVGLTIIAGLLLTRSLAPDPFERLRLAAFDSLQRVDPWISSSREVVVVDIDDASLQRLGQWPWSRTTIASLVRTLQDLGSKAIAFDVVFAEPDRTSPATLARGWERSFGWHAPQGASSLPDYDMDLAAAFARGRVVTGFGMLAARNGNSTAIKAGFATIDGDPAATVQNFPGAIPTLPALVTAAAGNGSFAITAGHDQVVRRLPMLVALEGRLAPSLSLEALRIAEDEDTIKVRAEHDAGAEGPVTGYTVRVGEHDVTLDADGSMVLHHGPRAAATTIPAWRLLDPGERGGLEREIRGRIVLIGTSAIGLADLRATPINPLEPGVNMHARALEQILSRHFLTRPAWAAGAEYLAAAIAAILIVTLVTFVGVRLAWTFGIAAAVVLIAGSWIAFARWDLLLDPTLVLMAVAGAGISASLARYLVVERDASRMRSAFTHYLSPSLVEILARQPDRLELGGELREMTFLFTDLEGFTSLIEARDPQSIVDLLNAYLDRMCSIAMEHGGTIDKIVGDALHVMFNAPLDQPDHAVRAVRCAIAIDAFATQFAAEQQARGIAFGATRIGVNTGPAVVGNFGGSRRFDYTAHGDAINTAARLEAANKALGTRICIAHATVEKVADVDFLPVGTLMLKGKAQGVDAFTPAGTAAAAKGWMPDYLKAFAQVVNGEESGSAALVALHERHPEHPILALHARRIRAGERTVRLAA